MEDSELKKILQDTCQVKPGQESRAWSDLRRQLFEGRQLRSTRAWLYYPSWRGLALAAVAIALVPAIGGLFFQGYRPFSVATADSQAPGVYATSFYSSSAKAQVVWLNGMDPATDKLTYQDATRSIPESAQQGDPNSL